ncbi:MAG: urate hydroxylase PuuD [Kiritimatiellia bacterium]|jgi:hypothetical protein|nr:urate hydroxylase PuuD [Pseudomonadales bacterium]MDP6470912.1 urate hydroxylase PuuD [Pseudomonadales bacterium]MDP6825903.1 urate hydroxylase PuuD [Pseudomonadales bacterium]MDP7024557.1 urate hydroxylase PuuD [Kiritimatiellia bacterium]|tara:strand:- start:1849 stop:2505 length:657 start_codon:yes stop_codon:yes gene_type:complete
MELILIDYVARWGHFLFGVAWIGLLYFFNFVQGEYFKEAEDGARVDAFSKMVPRALWWFRWGAMFTFLTGLIMLAIRGVGVSIDITLGAVLGTLMFLNVWLIIWPNQKIVIASNQQVQAEGEADPAAAGAAPKALLASRTNTLFSFPMLFLMGSGTHLAGYDHSLGDNYTALIVGLVIAAIVEGNAIFGKLGPIATVKGVITSGVVLSVVFWGVVSML